MDRYYCILDKNKECDNCCECEICDLNANKVCDNCGKCLETEAEYRAIDVDSIRDGVIEN